MSPYAEDQTRVLDQPSKYMSSSHASKGTFLVVVLTGRI